MASNLSENVTSCLEILKKVASIKDRKLRAKVLQDFSCDNALFQALQEISLNTQAQTLPLTKEQKQKLKRYRKKIEIYSKKSKLKTKRNREKIVVQSGGWVGIVLPTVISLLAALKK